MAMRLTLVYFMAAATLLFAALFDDAKVLGFVSATGSSSPSQIEMVGGRAKQRLLRSISVPERLHSDRGLHRGSVDHYVGIPSHSPNKKEQ